MLPIFQTIFSPPRHLILLIVAAWLGLLLSEKRLARLATVGNSISNLVFYGLVAFILGGRLFYAAAHLSAFIDSPLSLLSPNADLFEPVGAWFSAILAGVIYGRREGLQFWSTLDSLTPFFASVAVGLGLSHLAAGTAYGQPSNASWAIDQWNELRHPSQLYETLAAATILVFTLIYKRFDPAGTGFIAFTSLTIGAHLFLQAFRGDVTFVFGGFRQLQIVDWILLAASFIVMEIRKNAAAKAVQSDKL